MWSNGKRDHHQIALTFDDGPNEPYTSQVLNILGQYGVKATFFLIGQNVRHYPEVCLRIMAEGHLLGNHSYYHRKSLCLRLGKTIAQELELTRQTIYEYTGFEVKLFRPPYGFRTPWLMRTAQNLGYSVITWDNMTRDWKADRPAEQIVQAVLILRTKRGTKALSHQKFNKMLQTVATK